MLLSCLLIRQLAVSGFSPLPVYEPGTAGWPFQLQTGTDKCTTAYSLLPVALKINTRPMP